jgi:hypothetical protein
VGVGVGVPDQGVGVGVAGQGVGVGVETNGAGGLKPAVTLLIPVTISSNAFTLFSKSLIFLNLNIKHIYFNS